MQRAGDRTRLARTIFGGIILLFAVSLRVFHLTGSDWLILGLAILGAGMVSPTYVTDLVRAWRSGTKPDSPYSPSVHDA